MSESFVENLVDLVSRDRICNEWFGMCSKPAITEIDLHQAVDQILSDKPESIKDDNFINNLYSEVKMDDMLTAVLLTDVHLDLEYKEGTAVDCGDVLCCREEYGYPEQGQEAAGKWGAAFCDTPTRTFDNVLDHILNNVKPDLVFWAGDNSPHNIWSLTNESVSDYVIKATQMIQEKFDGTDITFIPAQGNHDTFPVDVQSFKTPNSNYPINHFKQYWSSWLDEQALEKFGEYGYYSMDLKLKNNKTIPEAKIITLNTNSCDKNNTYLINDRSDPGNQLKWLESELRQAEAGNIPVVLLSHH